MNRIQNLLTKEIIEPEDRLTSVSYTHLDVYKRQHSWFVELFFAQSYAAFIYNLNSSGV